jgi:hypothetical protein
MAAAGILPAKGIFVNGEFTTTSVTAGQWLRDAPRGNIAFLTQSLNPQYAGRYGVQICARVL